jgi:hypothetical protein
VAIIAPLALSFARRHRINQFMVGLLVVHGALAGAFSPISVYGIFINDYLAKNGLTPAPLTLFLAPFVFNAVFAVVVYLVLHRRPGLRAEADDALTQTESASATTRTDHPAHAVSDPDPDRAHRDGAVRDHLQLGCGPGDHHDLGVLAAIDPAAGKAAMSKVSWSIVVLICGVLTYIAVLQEAGTVEWVSAGISAIGVPLLAALLLFYMSGLISALASSLAIIGVVIALAVPFLESGDVHVGGFVAALAIAATIVDISPFSTNGAMLLANVHPSIRDRYYRQMIGYAGLMCLIGPGLAWVVAAVPTIIGS